MNIQILRTFLMFLCCFALEPTKNWFLIRMNSLLCMLSHLIYRRSSEEWEKNLKLHFTLFTRKEKKTFSLLLQCSFYVQFLSKDEDWKLKMEQTNFKLTINTLIMRLIRSDRGELKERTHRIEYQQRSETVCAYFFCWILAVFVGLHV